MAIVSSLHHQLHRRDDDDSFHHRRDDSNPLHTLNSEPCFSLYSFFLSPSLSSSNHPYSPPTNLHDVFSQPGLGPTNFNIGSLEEDDASSDPGSVIATVPDLLDRRENRIRFIMNLFQQRVEQSQVMVQRQDSNLGSDSINEFSFGAVEDSCDPDMDDLDLDLGLEIPRENCGLHNIGQTDNNNDYDDNIVIDEDDFFVQTRVSGFEPWEAESTVTAHAGGIQVNGFELDLDSDQNENSLVIDFHSEDEYGLSVENGNFENEDYEDEDEASVSIPFRWDSLQLDDRRENDEDFEWEEVDGRVDEREVLSVLVDDEEASVSLSISPIIAPEDVVNLERTRGLGNLEWQVLLNANNLESNAEQEQDRNGEPYFGYHDDYFNTAEYEMLFGQFADNESALMGPPPAAKSVVEKLSSVVLTKEHVESNNVLCAVCKDGIDVGEIAKQLPCMHQYHGECILPWLGIRNTCPVCRYELPTDDADYERKKAVQRAVTAGSHL
uniref:RING-type E3 ubiquitin transferase n=1 Tax=Rhizophora mucronata TaxID=61149 RepID=A0A2P2KUA8_RHIMU